MNINVFVRHLVGADDLHGIKQTLAKLIQLGEQIMTVISDFAAKLKDHQDRQAAALEGIQGDVKAINDKLTAIQNSPGTLSAEDQASLDEALARSEVLTTKLEALDAETPPTPPVA